MLPRVALDLHNKHIKGTYKEDMVQDIKVLVCRLTYKVQREGNFCCEFNEKPLRVYLSSRALKHIYDKRPAEEYDFLIEHLHKIVKYPGHIYKNKDSKRGNFCFIKTIKNNKYICSLEFKEKDQAEDGLLTRLEIVTLFRLNKENYLNSYELLWSWRDDASSS